MSKLTERQIEALEVLGQGDLSELEKSLKRYNAILAIVLNTPVDINSRIESNRKIKTPSEYQPMTLMERIHDAFKMEKAKNYMLVKAFMIMAIHVDSEDPFEVSTVCEIEFDEFIDGLIKVLNK